MRSSFGSKRKPRRLGQDDQDSGGLDSSTSMGPVADEGIISNITTNQCISDKYLSLDELTYSLESNVTVVRSVSKNKKRSSLLRTSFGPGGTSMNDEDEDGKTSAVLTPKKSSLGRLALEKNALKKSQATSIPSERIPLRQNDDRPSYSSDYLEELKTSTPSAPKHMDEGIELSPTESKELDLAAKFGSELALHRNSAIPSSSEIKEKKERRARLAKEQEFISLNSDDDEGGGRRGGDEDDDGNDDDVDSDDENSVLPYGASRPAKPASSRLVRDDEDVAEGFDEFVSDGRIALGKKAEREQKKRQKAEIRTLIDDAEGGDDDDSSEDESELERNAVYEAAQTRKGMEGLKKDDGAATRKRPRTPPRITPLPTLGGIMESLKEQMAAKEMQRAAGQARLEEVKKELEDIEDRKAELQRLVNESAERFAEMRRAQEREASGGEVVEAEQEQEEETMATAGLGSGLGMDRDGAGLGMGGMMAQRGLESLGDV